MDRSHRSILLVDDEEHALTAQAAALRSQGFSNTIKCSDCALLDQVMERGDIGVVLLDLTMPRVSGREILARFRRERPDTPVIIVTARDNVETAVGCMKEGAFDYLVKPTNRRELALAVGRALETGELRRQNQQLRDQLLSQDLQHPEVFREFSTLSGALRAVFRYAAGIAVSSQPVLITGETGVGKDLMARAVHDMSKRAGEYVAMNTAGIDGTVFSDTLFGHLKGSFTGAICDRAGLIERAAGGTLFLDEIGDLDATLQVKLLRLLQEGEYFALGSDVPKRAAARIVVATNRDLRAAMREGTFRSDLYYRLRQHHLHLPSLCKRKEDLPTLTKKFIERAAASLHQPPLQPTHDFMAILSGYTFPGNVRELGAMLMDATAAACSGKSPLDALVQWIRMHREEEASDVGSRCEETTVCRKEADGLAFCGALPSLQEAELTLVAAALEHANGNQAAAARILGISRQALNKRLAKQRTDEALPTDIPMAA